jgi:uncharacterized Zn finger protein
MFTLQDFDAHIPLKILQRGYTYYNDQAIASLVATAAGHWEALVAGTADYAVKIELDGKEVQSWSCDCPYEDGPVCKHVAAVLYALRDEEGILLAQHQRAEDEPDFEELLRKLTLKELREFIRHEKEGDREFGERFRLYFASKTPRVDVAKKYRDLVRQAVKRHSSRGFMDYRQTFAFRRDLEPVLRQAEKALDKREFQVALAIGQVLAEEVMGVLTHCDDSAGSVGGMLAQGIGILGKISQNESAGLEWLQQILAWLEKQLPDQKWFDYGDFGYDLLEVAEAAALRLDSERFLNLLDTLLNARTGKEFRQRFFREALIKHKIHFLQAQGREEAAALIEANLDIVEVRRMKVQQALERQDYPQAKQLIAGGIERAEQLQHPGTVRQWEEVLLQIAQAEGDLEGVRFWAKRFAFGRTFNKQYYELWKSTYPAEHWPEVIEQHIQSIIAEQQGKERKFDWDDLGHALFLHLAPICIQEEQWTRLLALIPENPDGGILDQVHPYLASRYPAELLALYLPVLTDMAERASDRKGYQALAAQMKRIKQDLADSHTAIDELAAELIRRYPRRPAMKEELGKLLGKK